VAGKVTKVWLISLLDKMCGSQLKLCDLSLARGIPEHLKESLIIKHYTNLRLLYFTAEYGLTTQ